MGRRGKGGGVNSRNIRINYIYSCYDLLSWLLKFLPMRKIKKSFQTYIKILARKYSTQKIWRSGVLSHKLRRTWGGREGGIKQEGGRGGGGIGDDNHKENSSLTSTAKSCYHHLTGFAAKLLVVRTRRALLDLCAHHIWMHERWARASQYFNGSWSDNLVVPNASTIYRIFDWSIVDKAREIELELMQEP